MPTSQASPQSDDKKNPPNKFLFRAHLELATSLSSEVDNSLIHDSWSLVSGMRDPGSLSCGSNTAGKPTMQLYPSTLMHTAPDTKHWKVKINKLLSTQITKVFCCTLFYYVLCVFFVAIAIVAWQSVALAKYLEETSNIGFRFRSKFHFESA